MNAICLDQQHGITFRYPAVWKSGTHFGYHPPALTALAPGQPVAGFAYEEGGFPRQQIVGPYTRTNLEGVGLVYSVLRAADAAECETKAASLAQRHRHSSVMIAGHSYSVYETGGAGMSQSISGKLYAAFSMGHCYFFETGVAISAAHAADNIQALTPAQSRDIDSRLENMMRTVRILGKR